MYGTNAKSSLIIFICYGTCTTTVGNGYTNTPNTNSWVIRATWQDRFFLDLRRTPLKRKHLVISRLAYTVRFRKKTQGIHLHSHPLSDLIALRKKFLDRMSELHVIPDKSLIYRLSRNQNRC